MRCCYRKHTAFLVFMFQGNLPNVCNPIENFTGDTNNFLPGRCDLGQMLATTVKNLYSQLIFQHPDLFADARL